MPQHLRKPRRAPHSRVISQRHANVDNTIDSVVGSTDYAADAVNADKAVAGGYRDSGGAPSCGAPPSFLWAPDGR